MLSPHPDDAVLSAWSALRRRGEVVVVNVFTAVPGDGVEGRVDRLLGASDSPALMRLRLDEDRRALAQAGRDRVNLDFLDEQYRDGPTPVGRMRDAVDSTVPTAAWLCAPAGLGGHADHVLVRELALEIGRAGSVPVSLYADLPYAVEWGWPHWVTGRPPRPFLVPEARWERDLNAVSVPRDRLVPRVHAFGPSEAANKLRALETYRTQFTWLNAGPLDRLRNPEVLGYELHWDVLAPTGR